MLEVGQKVLYGANDWLNAIPCEITEKIDYLSEEPIYLAKCKGGTIKAPEELFTPIESNDKYRPVFYGKDAQNGKDAQIRKELPKEFMDEVERYDRENNFPEWER